MNALIRPAVVGLSLLLVACGDDEGAAAGDGGAGGSPGSGGAGGSDPSGPTVVGEAHVFFINALRTDVAVDVAPPGSDAPASHTIGARSGSWVAVPLVEEGCVGADAPCAILTADGVPGVNGSLTTVGYTIPLAVGESFILPFEPPATDLPLGSLADLAEPDASANEASVAYGDSSRFGFVDADGAYISLLELVPLVPTDQELVYQASEETLWRGETPNPFEAGKRYYAVGETDPVDGAAPLLVCELVAPTAPVVQCHEWLAMP